MRWVMSDGAIPAWSAKAFFTPDAVADAGVGEGVGLAVGVAEAFAEGEAEADGEADGNGDGLAAEAGRGRVITATVPPATVTLAAGMPAAVSTLWTWLVVTLFLGW